MRLVALALLLAAGCADHGGTLVTFTLSSTGVAGDGKHYELFATVGGSAVSLRTFDVVLVPQGPEKTIIVREVRDHQPPHALLGVGDGFDQLARPIGGVRFQSRLDLTGATGLFITREDDDDTDPVPSRDVEMACTLEPGGRGTLACLLTDTVDKDVVLGTAALVLPDDGINPL